MIPRNLTNREFGLYLQAVGKQMEIHQISFGATFDGHSDEDMREFLSTQLFRQGADELAAKARARALLRMGELEVLDILSGETTLRMEDE